MCTSVVMSSSITKSIILSGNLNVDRNLTYKLCPNSTEFSQGFWNMSISSISYICNQRNVREICQFSCNFVKSQRWNTMNEIESYQQPFGMFLLESATKTIAFDQKWFKLKSDSNELLISVKNMNEDVLNIDCFVAVHVVFQKVY
jgi:hypothetical protein